MGAVRSEFVVRPTYGTYSYASGRVPATFAMAAACVIRRRQHIELGFSDPFTIAISTPSHPSRAVTRSSTPIGGQSITPSAQLERVNAQQDLNKSLLRLTFLLQSST